MRTVSLAEAKARLGELLNTVPPRSGPSAPLVRELRDAE